MPFFYPCLHIELKVAYLAIYNYENKFMILEKMTQNQRSRENSDTYRKCSIRKFAEDSPTIRGTQCSNLSKKRQIELMEIFKNPTQKLHEISDPNVYFRGSVLIRNSANLLEDVGLESN
jgi:hypothetical protein